LGLAFAKRLAADGANVVLADLKGADEAAGVLGGTSSHVFGLHADISSEDSVPKTQVFFLKGQTKT